MGKMILIFPTTAEVNKYLFLEHWRHYLEGNFSHLHIRQYKVFEHIDMLSIGGIQ